MYALGYADLKTTHWVVAKANPAIRRDLAAPATLLEKGTAAVMTLRMHGRSRAVFTRVPVWVAIVSAFALVVSACSSSGSGDSGGTGSGGDIKVMVIAPFTLPVAPAKANYDAVRLQAEAQNAKGGINGHKVVVIGCDDKSDPNVAAKCAQQAAREHVAALLGVFTLVAPSIWPIIEKAGIPSIGLVQYALQDMVSPNAWPLVPPAPYANSSSGAFLVKNKGCKNVADVQADAGANSKVPLALDKEAITAAGGNYVGPYLLTVTNGLANVPAVARSITEKADCATVALGQNGITLTKALLQQNPNFKVATNNLSLPGDWVQQLGSQATAVNGLGGVAPDTSTAPGIVDYFNTMKAKAPGDTLSDFSKLAWASWYGFAQVASSIKGDITAKSMSEALSHTTSVDTHGITGSPDFTKPHPVKQLTRVFSTQLYITGAQNGKAAQVGEPIQGSTLVPF
jgi:ABC-type branched-subunit amino acid transport system substrate-binding protein